MPHSLQLSTFTYEGIQLVIQEGALGDGVGSKVRVEPADRSAGVEAAVGAGLAACRAPNASARGHSRRLPWQ